MSTWQTSHLSWGFFTRRQHISCLIVVIVQVECVWYTSRPVTVTGIWPFGPSFALTSSSKSSFPIQALCTCNSRLSRKQWKEPSSIRMGKQLNIPVPRSTPMPQTGTFQDASWKMWLKSSSYPASSLVDDPCQAMSTSWKHGQPAQMPAVDILV